MNNEVDDIYVKEVFTDTSILVSGVTIGVILTLIAYARHMQSIYISKHTEGTAADAIKIVDQHGKTSAIYINPNTSTRNNMGLMYRVNKWAASNSSMVLIRNTKENLQFSNAIFLLGFIAGLYAIYQIFFNL